MRIDIWGDFIERVKEGNTYSFTNLRVKKNGKDTYVTTAKVGCCITESEPFDGELPLPPELPQSLLTTTVNVEIIGVNKFTTYYACTQCHKKLGAQDSHLAKCANCGLKQKLASCSSHCYLHALAKPENQNDTTLNLTIFDDVVKDLLATQGTPDVPLTEDAITEVLLALPIVEVTYNNSTKIVNALDIYH